MTRDRFVWVFLLTSMLAIAAVWTTTVGNSRIAFGFSNDAGNPTVPVSWLQEENNQEPDGSANGEQVRPERAHVWLGIEMSPVPPVVAAQIPALKSDEGVMVRRVVVNSPAEQAGLNRFDIIRQVEETEIESPAHLAELIRHYDVGETVAIELLRNGKSHTFNVTLETSPSPNPTDLIPKTESAILPTIDPRDLTDAPSIPLSWSESHSMSLSKDTDGNYRLEATYQAADQQIKRTFEGSKEEVLKAITDDDELPTGIKQKLRSSIENPTLSRSTAKDWMKNFRQTWQSDDFFFDDNFFDDERFGGDPFDPAKTEQLIEQFEKDVSNRLREMRRALQHNRP